MADDIQKCLEIYQEQLNNGYIRVAYVTLTKYVAELKANFPKAYTTSSVAFGYLYYTYFYFTNDYLKNKNLKYSVLEVILETKIDFSDKENMTQNVINRAGSGS